MTTAAIDRYILEPGDGYPEPQNPHERGYFAAMAGILETDPDLHDEEQPADFWSGYYEGLAERVRHDCSHNAGYWH